MGAFFNDIEVLWISRFDYKPGWILSIHAHKDFFQLIYCLKGSCTLSLDNKQYKIISPTVLLFPPGTKHGFSNIAKEGMKTLDTKFFIHSQQLFKICSHLPCVINDKIENIYDLLEVIRNCGNRKDLFYQENCQILLGEILLKLICTRLPPKEESHTTVSLITQEQNLSPICKHIISFIEQHFQEPLNSDILEKESNYSYRYISRIFKQEVKMTPFTFVEKYRILKAQDLLRYSDYELKRICEIVGYPDIHQFSKIFTRITGTPPGQWRKNTLFEICKDVLIHPGFENKILIKQIPLKEDKKD